MKHNHHRMSGYALITLLFFMIVAIIVGTAAVVVLVTNMRSSTIQQISTLTYASAEAGIENAIIRLIRDPTYSGETMTLPDGTMVITVTGTSPKTIRSIMTIGTVKRTVEADVIIANNSVTVQAWREVN